MSPLVATSALVAGFWMSDRVDVGEGKRPGMASLRRAFTSSAWEDEGERVFRGTKLARASRSFCGHKITATATCKSIKSCICAVLCLWWSAVLDQLSLSDQYLPLSDRHYISSSVLKLTACTSDRSQTPKSLDLSYPLLWMAVVDGISISTEKNPLLQVTW